MAIIAASARMDVPFVMVMRMERFVPMRPAEPAMARRVTWPVD